MSARPLSPRRINEHHRCQTHREAHRNPPQHGLRYRLPDGRTGVLQQRDEQASRDHKESETDRLDQIFGPVLEHGSTCTAVRSKRGDAHHAAWTIRLSRRDFKTHSAASLTPLILSYQLTATLLEELGNKSRPPGLVAGTDTGAIVTVKVFVHPHKVPPVRIGLKLGHASVHRSSAVRPTQKNTSQTTG